MDVSIDYTNNANKGSFDSVALSGTSLNVRGWHASNDAVGKPYSFIILYDKATHQQLGRYPITRLTRNDVHAAYPNIYQSAQSGFSLNIPFSSSPANKKIEVVSRYAGSATGDGNYVDYVSPKTYEFNQNRASFDSVKIVGNQLQIKGWHISDRSVDKPNSFIIIYDKTAGKELARYKIVRSIRSDVQVAYPNIYNSANGGFSVSVPFLGKFAGKDIQIISRYSNASSGEENYVDCRSTSAYTFNTNRGYVDIAKISGQTLTIRGWHISDFSAEKLNSFIILYDQTNHKELARYKVNRTTRPDVGNSFPNVYNSANSGFSLSVPAKTSFKNTNVQVISRYSTSSNGESGYVDYRSTPRKLN